MDIISLDFSKNNIAIIDNIAYGLGKNQNLIDLNLNLSHN